MISVFRAAGFAAAAVTLAVAAPVARPSYASANADVAASVSYIAHAAAPLEASELGLNSPEQSAQLPQIQNPVTPAAADPVAAHDLAADVPAPEASAPAATPAPRAQRSNRSLSEMAREYAGTQPRDTQADCLAKAIYFESNGEPLDGQLAVAEVIINRSTSGRFPSSICGVVRQPSQFSFVRGGRIPTPPQSSSGWRTAVAIAHIALDDLADSGASRAMFFHARRVSPGWRNLTRVATVGNHVFYR